MLASATLVSILLALSYAVAAFFDDAPSLPYTVFEAHAMDPNMRTVSELFEGLGSTNPTFTSPHPLNSSLLTFTVHPNGTLMDRNNKMAFVDTDFALLWSSSPPCGNTQGNFTVDRNSSSTGDLLAFNGNATLNWLVCVNPDMSHQLFVNHPNTDNKVCMAVNIVIGNHYKWRGFDIIPDRPWPCVQT